MMIDIHKEPPSERSIREKQTEMTTGQKVFFSCPIPIVDLVAGSVTSLIAGDTTAPWRDARGAVHRDWSADRIAQSYVDKVRLQSRDLAVCEVEALEKHLAEIGTVSGVLKDLGNVFKKHAFGL